MNNIKYLLTLVLCFCFMTVMAQRRISGHVWNKADGPVIMANVVELDKDNRIVSATQTDASGNFSMSIKNPANRLRVTYIGYAPRELPIGGTSVFRIEMESKAIKEVVIKGTRRVNSNGFSIPAREISVAQQSLNMDEMEGLSFETAGEPCKDRSQVLISWPTPVTWAQVRVCVCAVSLLLMVIRSL